MNVICKVNVNLDVVKSVTACSPLHLGDRAIIGLETVAS